MKDFSAVQHFIDTARRCRNQIDLQSLLDEHTVRLGFDYFALVHHVDLRRRKSNDAIALWSYPANWVEEYLAHNMATSDPVHLASHRTNIGFTWDHVARLIPVTAAHREVRERTQRAGICDGFTVPANIPGEANGSCSFAVGTGRPLPRASLAAAQLLGSFAFYAARRLSYRKPATSEPPRLSPRQLDCLIHIGRGASDRETATALGIAEDTVTEYIDEARRRYGVARRTPLVLRAVFDGQIALSDVLMAPPLKGEVAKARRSETHASHTLEALMVTLINQYNRERHKPVLDAMHAARKRVFVDMLGWDVPHDGIHERDEFDDEDATYLVMRDPATGDHLASMRLLRTDRRHILGDIFPQLCESAPPRAADIREITRFCLSPGVGRIRRLEIRKQLVRAFIEYALLAGIRAYTGVADMAWLMQILAAGWDVRPLGLPQRIDGALLGALEIRITAHTLQQLAPDWRCDPAPLRVVEFDLPLAA